jgi:hypothetical protein
MLGEMLNNDQEVAWRILGDFNVIRSTEERRINMAREQNEDFSQFNQYINGNFLIDLPLCCRNYTWYQGDGVSMSRLDKFLLSKFSCSSWQNCIQVDLPRCLFDHCPILITIEEEDWGPRRQRMLKGWTDLPRYKEFVKEKWFSYQVHV